MDNFEFFLNTNSKFVSKQLKTIQNGNLETNRVQNINSSQFEMSKCACGILVKPVVGKKYEMQHPIATWFNVEPNTPEMPKLKNYKKDEDYYEDYELLLENCGRFIKDGDGKWQMMQAGIKYKELFGNDKH